MGRKFRTLAAVLLVHCLAGCSFASAEGFLDLVWDTLVEIVLGITTEAATNPDFSLPLPDYDDDDDYEYDDDEFLYDF